MLGLLTSNSKRLKLKKSGKLKLSKEFAKANSFDIVLEKCLYFACGYFLSQLIQLTR